MVETLTPLDIILPVHGRLELTREAVNAIYAHTKSPFHLIVMDDSDASIRDGAFHPVDCTDTTSAFFEKLCQIQKNITYYNSPTPFKCGNEFFNKGFTLCKYDYVATVMNSIRVEPEWEVLALKLMNDNPSVGIIGFKNIFPDGKIESASIKFVEHLPTDFGRNEPSHRLNGVFECEAVQWAFALLRKKAVVGVLDESLFEGFVGWDDIDNCFAVRAKGWKILYCGLGAGIHIPRATRGDDRRVAQIKNQKNAETFWKRWGLMEKAEEYKRSQNRMDITNKLSEATRESLATKVMEFQLLKNMSDEKFGQLLGLGNKALSEAKISPDDYEIEVNPTTRTFLVKPKSTHPVQKIEAPLPPAGDTKTDEPAMAGGEVKV